MASKDLHRGWGTLPPGLLSWRCPMCSVDSPVVSWKQVVVLANGHELDGRECPSCQHKSSTLSDSDQMVPVPKPEPVAVAKKKTAKKKVVRKKNG